VPACFVLVIYPSTWYSACYALDGFLDNEPQFSEVFEPQQANLYVSLAGKKVSKAPKIQRLVTPLTLQRKRARIADKKKRITKKKSEAAEYQKLLAQRLKEQRDRRSESLAKRRSKLSAAAKASAATSA
jgi:3'-phosphoadenosine 5'-phosphosulfate (PAPS) 3'-phosphatase